ncbi:MAG: AEC family transporter [Candidatus Protistobacter heckmanni]|nr:AEC family transporter [Candidatus Protistobacter heckmanni]
MQSLFLLLPDFALILLGWCLMCVSTSRYAAKHPASPLGNFTQTFWRGIEQMVYYLLFLSLLFYSTNRANFDLRGASDMLLAATLTVCAGIVLSYTAHWICRPVPLALASGTQTGFHFNSYVCLAVAGRIADQQGIALMAVLVGAMVPLVNIAAVWSLAARGQSGLWKELARNPLIIATVLGLGTNLIGWHPPEPLAMLLSRLGASAIALGLMTVCAGLQFGRMAGSPGLVAWWTGVKLLAMLAIALLLSRHMAMSPTEARVLVAFAAMPTASSFYILAMRMGGDGPLVALLVSAMTLGALFTLPLWLAIVI